jgi:cytochrome c biogenesis protein CcmG, thiol:disulfide interchange protein DsbE
MAARESQAGGSGRNQTMSRWVYTLPAIAFLVLAVFLFRSLFAPAPDIIPSALLDRPAPRLALPALDAKSAAFTRGDLASGHVSVINVFASWCAPCRTETAQLAALAGLPGVALYGLVQKDKPDAARAFLDEFGNPFARIARDDDGRASIEWGVYGVPETYVVDGKGIVRFKYVGALTDKVLAEQVLPVITRIKAAS